MTIRKFYTFRVNDSTPDDHTGRLGEITYRDGFLYYHDGVTAGGEVIGGGGGSGGPTSWSSVTGKPSFATVATSGSYTDLTNKPSIPTDINDLTDTDSLLANTGDFAFSGGTASLPAGGVMVLDTFQAGGNKQSTLTLSTAGISSLDVGNNLRIRVGNGTGSEKDWIFGADGSLRFPDASVQSTAYTGSYNDLTDTPTIPSLDGYATESWVNSQGFGSGSGSSDRLVNGNKSLILASDGNVDVNGHIAIKKESDYLSTIGKTTTFGTTILNTKLFVNYNEVGITSTIDVETMPDETTTATVKVGGAVATMLSTDNDAGDPVTQYRGQLDVSYTGITLTLATPTTETNWVFDNNNLKLPAGGDIVDINGNSVLGGGGVSLPANASGYLTNDGAGNLSWAAGDGTFSGDYNDLVNKPSIPAAQINSDWNETISESPAYIFNKPTIPTSLSDFGITAGLDGQVLTLNSSLTPVWATPSGGGASTGDITFDGVKVIGAETNRGGGSIELVPNDAYYGSGQYLNIYPTMAQDAPHIHIAAGTGGDLILGDDDHYVDVNNQGTINIKAFDSATNNTGNWAFKGDGSFAINNNEVHIATNNWGISAPANATTVVYTAKQQNLASIRVHATIEGNEDSDVTGLHSQACDMMIVRRVAIGGAVTVDSVVYGVIYTGAGPLATLDAQWNATTNRIEITATPTSTANNVYVKIYATEVARGD